MKPFRKVFDFFFYLDNSKRKFGGKYDKNDSFGENLIKRIESDSERSNILSDCIEATNYRNNENRMHEISQNPQIEEIILKTNEKQINRINDLDLKTFKIVVSNFENNPIVSKMVENFNLDSTLITTSCNSPYSLKSYNQSKKDFEMKLNTTNNTPITTSLDFQSDENSKSLSNVYTTEEEMTRENKDEEIDFLELLLEEVLNTFMNNLPYLAYCKFLELSEFLFRIIEKRVGIGKSIVLEMNLILNNKTSSNNVISNNYQNSSNNTTQSTSSFHNTLKSLKFGSNRNNTVNNNNNIDFNKSKFLIEPVHLNRNGVPIKFSNGNSSNSHSSSGTGSSRKWRYHISSSCSNGGNNVSNNSKSSKSDSTSQMNLGYKKAKLFLESISLLPKRSEENKEAGQNQKSIFIEDMENFKPNLNSKFVRLEDFPCIIFSQNCFPVSNSKFSSIIDRNLALEFLKFPTEIKCLGLEQESRLSEFITKLVTNMHIHRLRFTLYKCSTSYTDLVLALKYKKKHLNNKSEEQFRRNLDEQLQNEKSNKPEISNSEWNSLGDSNLGMWWTMGTESEFLILCDYIVNTNPINVVSIVNECDLHLKWAPFVTSSECLAYIGLYNQLVRHYSNMPWPIGLCQCSLYCVAIDINRQEEDDSEPCIIITAVSLPEKADSVCGIKVKEAQSNASKLDILSLCFVIQSVPNCPSQTRISFLSKSNMPIPSFVPKAVPSFIAKQIGKSFFNNIISIIERFNSTPFYQRIKSDTEFYEFVKKRMNILDDSKFDFIQDPSPIKKKTQKEIKQRKELNESYSKEDLRDYLHKSGINSSQTQNTNHFSNSYHIKEANPFTNLGNYSVVKTMMRMFPSF
ncbi:uncharacterized protein cubi_01682 [Cryptosporidium ubiquitum]|uniref:START domain-containing protein n=1 Tax=Cryptosporidium ubiquitum TaxID=857276 RepID=A0A1J4MI78_9CRYT|nr:uncharacterized protein cubi_01682 [Cryptosporidium ubiquitum]OII72732.1 hypothetical protein cubi_01682 [Cryptosporidium ubiquitum]